MSKEKTKKQIDKSNILTSVILLVLGVLFCLKIAASTISIVIGAAMLLLGVVNLIFMATKKRTFASADGVINGALIAIGLVFIIDKFLNVFLGLIPYIMIVVGVLLVIDAFLARFQRKDKLPIFIIELVIGIAAIVIGFCLLFVDGFKQSASIAFGVVLIIGAIAELIRAIAKK